MSIRLATREDLPAIVSIYNSTIPGRMVTADLEPVTVLSREGWFKAHDERHPLWVVDGAAGVAAWMSFQPFYGRAAYGITAEVSVYVDEERRREGLGRKLVEHALGVAPEHGIHTLLGFIFGHNDPSLRLFDELGFDRWGCLPRVAVLDGIERDLVIVGRRVQPEAPSR